MIKKCINDLPIFDYIYYFNYYSIKLGKIILVHNYQSDYKLTFYRLLTWIKKFFCFVNSFDAKNKIN